MRLAKSSLVHLAAVATLAAASTSAFAQSAEYRRGYDDGYQAALREAGGHGGNGGWGRLYIEEAEYGRRGAMCDARRAVREAVERNNGVVVVNNRLCGDPIRGTEKRLRVIYRCGDSEPVRVVAQEDERLRLSCRR